MTAQTAYQDVVTMLSFGCQYYSKHQYKDREAHELANTWIKTNFPERKAIQQSICMHCIAALPASL